MSGASVSLVRLWTRVYTTGLPDDLREGRRAEVDADLWESLHDPGDRGRQILPRLVTGVWDDLSWRAGLIGEPVRQTSGIVTVGGLALLALWQLVARPAVSDYVLHSVWAFPIAESLHVLGVAVFVGLTILLDLRLLGVTLRRVPVSEIVGQVMPWASAGAALTIVAGLVVFAADQARYLDNVFFQVKVVALAIALINSWMFHAVVYPGVAAWDRAAVTPLAARVSGGLSLAVWTTVIAAGRLIAYH